MLRCFIIEHPFARIVDIGRTFSQSRYVTAADVSDLYMETDPIADVLQYADQKGQQCFWTCDHCGPLRVKHGELQSIKPTSCGKHCPRHQGGWKPVTPSRQLRVLRKGIHQRVHLPGVPELKLLKWLEERQREHQHLLRILPWPHVDTYDFQLRFVDSTWAVDIKDYAKPHHFGRYLSPLYSEGALNWDKGFYVYPAFRERQRRDYGEVARQEARRLSGIEIVSDETFQGRVLQKLNLLEKSQ